MKFKAGNTLVAVILFLWAGCGREPNYSVIPNIALAPNGLKFISASAAGGADTLRISLRFTDGDGDLGLDNSSDNTGDFAEKFYNIYYTDYQTDKMDGSPYSLNEWRPRPAGHLANAKVIYKSKFWTSVLDANISVPGNSRLWKEFFPLNYKAKRTISAFQSFPEFVRPYSCTEWEVISYQANNTDAKDTLSVEFNPNYYNIFVDIYEKKSDGKFAPFDPSRHFSYPNCSLNLLNGRFPILASDSKNSSPLNGVITYSIPSRAFLAFFANTTLRLDIYILDRARHKSNVVETSEFTLQSIKGR